MNLRIDTGKSYGIALEGGGARGAYQIGVWKAMREVGLHYHMISGTSVGALNGALMTMGDFDLAESVWSDIHISKVVNLEGMDEADMLRLCKKQLKFTEMRKMAPQLLSILYNGGLDIQPLREWIREIVDTEKVRLSDVELFACTYSLSEWKGKEVRINDLPESEMCDMLLASAYYPAFRMQKLGGKLYADGGFYDSLPIRVLIDHNCRDIIAVPLNSLGNHRRVIIPENVSVTTIRTSSELGEVLEFDSTQAKKNIELGYYDAMRTFYGLYGKVYCIEKTMTEAEALQWMADRYHKKYPETSLRELCEEVLPDKAKKLGARDGDYYDLFIAVVERLAQRHALDRFRFLTDRELLSELS